MPPLHYDRTMLGLLLRDDPDTNAKRLYAQHLDKASSGDAPLPRLGLVWDHRSGRMPMVTCEAPMHCALSSGGVLSLEEAPTEEGYRRHHAVFPAALVGRWFLHVAWEPLLFSLLDASVENLAIWRHGVPAPRPYSHDTICQAFINTFRGAPYIYDDFFELRLPGRPSRFDDDTVVFAAGRGRDAAPLTRSEAHAVHENAFPIPLRETPRSPAFLCGAPRGEVYHVIKGLEKAAASLLRHVPSGEVRAMFLNGILFDCDLVANPKHVRTGGEGKGGGERGGEREIRKVLTAD